MAAQKRSILIGSNGYLGRHMAYHLQLAGFDNLNCDIRETPPDEMPKYRQTDITNPADLEKLCWDVDYVFLFAGLTGTANGFEDYKKFIQINETGLLNVLTRLRKTGSNARLVYPSTRLVYKGVKNHMLKEDDPKEAKTIYAANKLNAENLLWMYHNAFEIDYTIFRICVPYGNLFDEAFSYGTIGFFLSQARRRKDITLYGDGSLRRTFTHASDISNIIIRSIQLEKTKNQIFNIGGENLSLLDAARVIATKYGVSVRFSDWPEMAKKLESDDTVFDDLKLKSLIDFEYKFTCENWITGT